MIIKIIKMDGEFTIVELENGNQKICPKEFFLSDVKEGDVYNIIKEYNKHPHKWLIEELKYS